MESTYKGRFVVSRDHRPGSQTPNAWGPTCTFFTRLHDVTRGWTEPTPPARAEAVFVPFPRRSLRDPRLRGGRLGIESVR